MRNICRMSGCLVQRSLHRIHLPFPPWLSDTLGDSLVHDSKEEGRNQGKFKSFFWHWQCQSETSKPQKDPDPQWQCGLDLRCFSYVEAPFHPDGREVASGNKKLGLSSAVEWGLKDLLLSGGWWVWNGERVKLNVSCRLNKSDSCSDSDRVRVKFESQVN